MTSGIQAFHLPVPDGFRFCVLRAPPAGVERKGGVVHIPAFGEEMNRSRRMVALQADLLAADGWLVMQIDPLGTGDSSGDFGDAGWDAWLADVKLAVDWMRGQEVGEIWLWGLRLGGLLAAEAVRRFDLRCGLLLWQPVTSGKQHLQQFLRLWKAARIVGKAVDETRSPQQRLDAGEPAEVAGYSISPALAGGMQHAALSAVAAVPAVHWLHIGAPGALEPTPAFARLHEAWTAREVPVSFAAVEGPPFWQTQEIEEVSELLARTRALMAAGIDAARRPA
ncbi:hydrolase 2, exosortase A system-associated [Pseudothauera rhizosphaerae]|uniref:Hydrolase 2, exosortase A system-associated n=1 Tax=Pseudothauera rhizosphaerae TaxID=2565932 RepID=A0A4S4APJ1_9RHOO|nr:hydrolase 2, exosortase A system-associated [Pseudothauera rhizosphaerae]THF61614.1 hydrolase 2, exosortase A system-associated [Pseudothauera rhizosphaerae]